MKKRAAEIQQRFDDGWRFSIDWPPGFQAQAAPPPRQMHPVVLDNLRRGRELQRASQKPALMEPTGTPFNPRSK